MFIFYYFYCSTINLVLLLLDSLTTEFCDDETKHQRQRQWQKKDHTNLCTHGARLQFPHTHKDTKHTLVHMH